MSRHEKWSDDAVHLKRLDPHQFDYKRRVVDERVDDVMEIVNRRPGEAPLPFHEFVQELSAWSERVKYHDSAAKTGVMLQASCVITSADRGATGPRVVLVQRRANVQFHDARSPRALSGGACLIGTVAGRLSMLDGFGHISNDIFTRLTVPHFNPLALFGRKLLLPEPVVETRFLGLGFNRADWSEKRRAYLHLIWQVLVEDEDSLRVSLVVPERDGVNHDVLVPVPREEAAALLDPKARIDAAALQAALHPCDAAPFIGADDAGLLGAAMFSLPSLSKRGPQGAKYSRESVIFDLLRLFQTAVHRGELTLGDHSERALQAALREFFEQLGRQLPWRLEVREEEKIGAGPRSGRIDLRVLIWPSRVERGAPRAHWEYILECKVDERATFRPDSIAQCLEYSAKEVRAKSALAMDGRAECVILVQGVRRARGAFAMGGVELLDRDHLVYGIRVALNANSPSEQRPAVRVAHGVLAVRVGECLGIVITLPRETGHERAPGKPNPRLPGGRLDRGHERVESEFGERQEDARDGLLRELAEELGLDESMIATLQPIRPTLGDALSFTGPSSDYFSSHAVSQKTGVETVYHLYPFLVSLNVRGGEQLLTLLARASTCEGDGLRLVEPATWTRTGLRFDASYAAGVVAAIASSALQRAAIQAPEGALDPSVFWDDRPGD